MNIRATILAGLLGLPLVARAALAGETRPQSLVDAAKLARRAAPDAPEVNGGRLALLWAISERHASVAEGLVRRGADIQVRSKRGSAALMFAAQHGDADSVRTLLAAGAKPNDAMARNGLT